MKKRAKKTKVETVSKEEAERQDLERSLKDCLNKHIPENPTKYFSVGEEVNVYSWDYVRIEDDKCLKSGTPFLYYKVFVRHDPKPYGVSQIKEYYTYIPWYDIFKKDRKSSNITFTKEESLRIQFMNQDISTLLFKVYRSGVDFNPDYQRGLVWDLKDKISLLDSIFNNIDIGKFVFIERPFGKYDRLEGFINYEILDGKQRLTTLCEFYEGRFEYHGFKFEELNFRDRHKILGKIVQVAEVREDVTQKQKYEYFLKMNTQGKPQSEDHLNMIKKKLEGI